MALYVYDSPSHVKNIHQIYMATLCGQFFLYLLKQLSFFV